MVEKLKAGHMLLKPCKVAIHTLEAEKDLRSWAWKVCLQS